jgi:Rod binding domain-containing protein
MTKPIGLGSPGIPPSFPRKEDLHWGKDASSAPVSPTQVAPHIDKSKVNPEILKAAEGMEAMFLDYMMQVMRQTVPKNEMDLESPASEIYRGMLDSEYAQKAAHQGGIGLADQVIAYLDGQVYNLPQGHGVPNKEKP